MMVFHHAGCQALDGTIPSYHNKSNPQLRTKSKKASTSKNDDKKEEREEGDNQQEQ